MMTKPTATPSNGILSEQAAATEQAARSTVEQVLEQTPESAPTVARWYDVQERRLQSLQIARVLPDSTSSVESLLKNAQSIDDWVTKGSS